MRTRVAAAAVLLLVSAGCGSAPGSGDDWKYDPERSWQLAGDPDASVADLVDVGSIASIADSGSQRLVTYVVEPEDDEGRQQGVWRLYDDRGERVSGGKLGIVQEQTARATGHVVRDGFLIESYRGGLLHVSVDGKISHVSLSRKPRMSKAGDVLTDETDDRGGPLVYHQDTHDAAPLPLKYPEGYGPQGLAIDESGALWVQDDPRGGRYQVRWTRDGKRWQRTPLKAAVKGAYLVGGPVASDGQVLLAEAGGGPDESSPVIGIWHTPAGRAAWTRTPVKGAPVDELSASALSIDGELVLGGEHGMFRVGPDGTLSPVAGPTKQGAVISTDNGLYWLDDVTQRAWHAQSLDDDWEPVPR